MPIAGKRRWDAIAVAAIALLAGSLVASPAFGVLRGLSLDALTALHWRVIGNQHDAAVSPVVVVAFDEETYRTAPFRGTPTITWTREIGRILTAVIDGGARVVGFDVVFPTSIEESEIPFDGDTIGVRLRGFDRDFRRALAGAAQAGKVVLGELQHGDDLIVPSPGQRVAIGQQRNIRSVNVIGDSDGVVRRIPLVFSVGDKTVPAMALELASRALGVAPDVGADQRLTLAGYRIPTHLPNAMTLNFHGGANDFPTYSIADLHTCLDKGDAAFFRRNFQGKVVLVGSTLDFEDRKMTSKRLATAPGTPAVERCGAPAPQDATARRAIDGVYVHATAIENLMRRNAITEMPFLATWFVTTAGAAVAAFAAFALAPLAAVLSFLALALAWTAGATAAFGNSLALPLFEPCVAGLVALGATTSFRLFVTDRDKRFLRRAFALYLAPAVIEKMLSSSQPPVLGGEMRNVTALFSDVVGFASLAETTQPTELVALMNRYFSAMTDIIEAYGGFVDKYPGDGILAVFGAPHEGANHAVDAVRAALRCCADLAELNRAEEAGGGRAIRHRIGLSSGEVLVGNIGSRRRFNYTVIGDTVNLAARLESANTHYGTSILASETTVAIAGNAFAWREIDLLRVKGRVQPVYVYEPLAAFGQENAQQTASASCYARGLARWRARDFAGAAQSFAAAGDADMPSRLFAERAKALAHDPPGPEWAPITTLDTK